jgi:hypothetical protein
MKKFEFSEYNNAQKSTASLVGVLICINILPIVATMAKSTPAAGAIVGLVAQILFVMFIYFALLWLRKE